MRLRASAFMLPLSTVNGSEAFRHIGEALFLTTLSVIRGSANQSEFWENSPPVSHFGVLFEFFPDSGRE